MPTKSKLQVAVEKRAASLNDVQREIVLAQFADYRKNKARIAQIEKVLNSPHPNPPAGSDAMKDLLARRMTLANERAQLVAANSEITSKLFFQLGGKEDE